MPKTRQPDIAVRAGRHTGEPVKLRDRCKEATVTWPRAAIPAGSAYTVRLEFSYDGGQTWPEHVTGTFNGGDYIGREGQVIDEAMLSRPLPDKGGTVHTRLIVDANRAFTLAPSLEDR